LYKEAPVCMDSISG